MLYYIDFLLKGECMFKDEFLSEYFFSSFSSTYYITELYKKNSRIDPLKKVQAKQLINAKIAKLNSLN